MKYRAVKTIGMADGTLFRANTIRTLEPTLGASLIADGYVIAEDQAKEPETRTPKKESTKNESKKKEPAKTKVSITQSADLSLDESND